MDDGTTTTDWPYVWRCGECGETFPATGSGHWHVMNHAKSAHGMKPNECVDGLLDQRSGEIVKEGCGTAVLQYCSRQGWIEGVAAGDDADTGVDPPEVAPPRAVRSDKASTRRQMNELRRLELRAQQNGRVVMKDVVLDKSVLLLHYEAQALWPDRYSGNPEASLSLFITDCAILFASQADMTAIRVSLEGLPGTEEEENDG